MRSELRPGTPTMSKEHTEHLVYMLESAVDPSKHYTGYTRDLEARLQDHNVGDAHTRRNIGHGG